MGRTIKVDYVARVEGEASFEIVIEDGMVKKTLLNVWEPIRLFEAFLVGRKYDEIHEIASRICGICYAAHQITALRAVEKALGIQPPEEVTGLRRLLTLGGMLQSHLLSLCFLAIHDYAGYESVFAMLKERPKDVELAFKLKKLGNDIQELVGGRPVHPVTTLIGRFSDVPRDAELRKIRRRLEDAKGESWRLVEILKSAEIPEFERKCPHLALKSEDGYPLNFGLLASTDGLLCPEDDYRKQISERQVPPSHAKHSTIKNQSFLVGPLARFNLNYDKLCGDAKRAAGELGIKRDCYNPLMQNIARTVEVIQYIDDAIRVTEELEGMDLGGAMRPHEIRARGGRGCAITEAPRGLLYHCYEFKGDGTVARADIVTPTGHNVFNIENDLREYAPRVLNLSEGEAKLACEMLVRAYDPCFSCSVHLTKIR